MARKFGFRNVSKPRHFEIGRFETILFPPFSRPRVSKRPYISFRFWRHQLFSELPTRVPPHPPADHQLLPQLHEIHESLRPPIQKSQTSRDSQNDDISHPTIGIEWDRWAHHDLRTETSDSEDVVTSESPAEMCRREYPSDGVCTRNVPEIVSFFFGKGHRERKSENFSFFRKFPLSKNFFWENFTQCLVFAAYLSILTMKNFKKGESR